MRWGDIYDIFFILNTINFTSLYGNHLADIQSVTSNTQALRFIDHHGGIRQFGTHLKYHYPSVIADFMFILPNYNEKFREVLGFVVYFCLYDNSIRDSFPPLEYF